MSKLKTVRYSFEEGVAQYVYRYKHHQFVGTAICHDEDKDFESRMLGLDLAETRAYLDYLRIRRDELAIRHQTLKGMYQYLSDDKNFNKDDFYAKKIANEIDVTYEELEECREAIHNIPRMMDAKITNRELLYQKIREKRKTTVKENKGE